MMNNTIFIDGGLSPKVPRQRHLAALKKDIAAGIEDLENGHYQIYLRK